MHFLNPQALWLLTVFPLLAAALVWFGWRRKEKLLDQFGERSLVNRFSDTLKSGRFIFKAACVALALSAMIVAIARPSFEQGHTEFPRGSIDVIAIVDVSRSMAVPDYKGKMSGVDYEEGRRIDMARQIIVNDVVKSLNYNRLGVVSYSGEAFPQAFLSDDMVALDWVLKRALTVGSAPGEGSELAKAFELAFTLFDLDSKPGKRKIVVLFSDGGNDSGREALGNIISELKKRDIELMIVGLGKTVGSPIPVKLLNRADQERLRGQGEFYKKDGEVVTSALDENTLLLLKNATGARYVRVTDANDFHIGSLVSRTEVTVKKGEQEVFFWPLLASLLFFALAFVAPREIAADIDDKTSKNRPAAKKRR